ncbi:hypothetical protein GCM10007939_13530 [Amylibacter marinus]|uniref:DUF2834 domain-containing protein n=1 Tax=Amylibacter marinus TaxID=1475483 RepID=A0ABQ5VUR3_9RHOB|nr:DUF2834 domain-containing protein [Amylibacter marinus]GLQ35070.1 hypothetical protein GCM10007939_13530 [Amylibacter marinus]
MSVLRVIYLVLALCGAGMSVYFGDAPILGGALARVEIFAGITLCIWIIAEVYVRHDYWLAPLCIFATFGIGVGCGLPLYLFFRSRSFR